MESDEKRAAIVIIIMVIAMICIAGFLLFMSLPQPTPPPVNNTVEPFFNRTVLEVR